MRMLLYLQLILFAYSSVGQQRLTQAISLYNESKQLYQKEDYEGYLIKSLEARTLLPYSRAVVYNLAAAFAVNGQAEESLATIGELIQVDNRIEFNADSVFANIKSNPKYSDYLVDAEDLSDPISNSQVAFELDQIDLHPESIAYSEATELFYISSMRKRKIVTYDPRTRLVSDWITTNDHYDLYGVMGMKVSPDGGSIWFCSSPMPQMEGYTDDGRYTPSIFKIQLEDKRKVDRFALPIGSLPGDLVLSPTGVCYVSDSAVPRIFRIKGKQAQLLFDGNQTLVNLQGLTLYGDFLFIADYLLGIHRLTISDGSLIPIPIAYPYNTAGVDGLYYYNNSLIAIQNGVYPFRIGRFFLGDHQKIKKFEYFEKASDYLDEPTLGLMLNDQFYFVANSPWSYYDGSDILVEHINKPQIRKFVIGK